MICCCLVYDYHIGSAYRFFWTCSLLFRTVEAGLLFECNIKFFFFLVSGISTVWRCNFELRRQCWWSFSLLPAWNIVAGVANRFQPLVTSNLEKRGKKKNEGIMLQNARKKRAKRRWRNHTLLFIHQFTNSAQFDGISSSILASVLINLSIPLLPESL